MKKIICVCLCICLMSGCGKRPNHGSTVNTVADSGESIPISEPSKSPATEPTFTPNPTPEPKGTNPSLPANGEPSSWFSCVSWYSPTINTGFWGIDCILYFFYYDFIVFVSFYMFANCVYPFMYLFESAHT
ncbi:MAG: hypothetical protein LE169_04095 [Endomicrobium sp.]|nr:hypothetical protein [Endomicrobium sp.]